MPLDLDKYKVPEHIQEDIDVFMRKLDGLTCGVSQVGYWVWVTDKKDAETYKGLGMRWSPKRQSWFWIHPSKANKGRRYSKSTSTKTKSKPVNVPKPVNAIDEQIREVSLGIKKWNKMLQVDSGENHINIHREIGSLTKQLEELETRKRKKRNEDGYKQASVPTEMDKVSEQKRLDDIEYAKSFVDKKIELSKELLSEDSNENKESVKLHLAELQAERDRLDSLSKPEEEVESPEVDTQDEKHDEAVASLRDLFR